MRFSKSIVQLAGVDRLLELGLGLRERGAPQDGLHAAAELAHRERLRDVVVGAELEAEHLVGLLGLRGEHDDRHGAARADRAADVEAVHPRQHHVEHDEVEVVLAQPVERLPAVERRNDVVALLAQGIGQQLLDRQLVVDEQDARGRGCSTFENCRLRRSDRAADLPRGVRAGPSGDRAGDVLVPEPAEAAAAGTGRGRALRRQPGGRARDPDRDRAPGPPRGHARATSRPPSSWPTPSPRAGSAAAGGRPDRAALHARGATSS